MDRLARRIRAILGSQYILLNKIRSARYELSFGPFFFLTSFHIGISEGLDAEITPFGLRSIVFEPGSFRTSIFNTQNIAPYAQSIDDYKNMTSETTKSYKGPFF